MHDRPENIPTTTNTYVTLPSVLPEFSGVGVVYMEEPFNETEGETTKCFRPSSTSLHYDYSGGTLLVDDGYITFDSSSHITHPETLMGIPLNLCDHIFPGASLVYNPPNIGLAHPCHGVDGFFGLFCVYQNDNEMYYSGPPKCITFDSIEQYMINCTEQDVCVGDSSNQLDPVDGKLTIQGTNPRPASFFEIYDHTIDLEAVVEPQSRSELVGWDVVVSVTFNITSADASLADPYMFLDSVQVSSNGTQFVLVGDSPYSRHFITSVTSATHIMSFALVSATDDISYMFTGSNNTLNFKLHNLWEGETVQVDKVTLRKCTAECPCKFQTFETTLDVTLPIPKCNITKTVDATVVSMGLSSTGQYYAMIVSDDPDYPKTSFGGYDNVLTISNFTSDDNIYVYIPKSTDDLKSVRFMGMATDMYTTNQGSRYQGVYNADNGQYVDPLSYPIVYFEGLTDYSAWNTDETFEIVVIHVDAHPGCDIPFKAKTYTYSEASNQCPLLNSENTSPTSKLVLGQITINTGTNEVKVELPEPFNHYSSHWLVVPYLGHPKYSGNNDPSISYSNGVLIVPLIPHAVYYTQLIAGTSGITVTYSRKTITKELCDSQAQKLEYGFLTASGDSCSYIYYNGVQLRGQLVSILDYAVSHNCQTTSVRSDYSLSIEYEVHLTDTPRCPVQGIRYIQQTSVSFSGFPYPILGDIPTSIYVYIVSKTPLQKTLSLVSVTVDGVDIPFFDTEKFVYKLSAGHAGESEISGAIILLPPNITHIDQYNIAFETPTTFYVEPVGPMCMPHGPGELSDVAPSRRYNSISLSYRYLTSFANADNSKMYRVFVPERKALSNEPRRTGTQEYWYTQITSPLGTGERRVVSNDWSLSTRAIGFDPNHPINPTYACEVPGTFTTVNCQNITDREAFFVYNGIFPSDATIYPVANGGYVQFYTNYDLSPPPTFADITLVQYPGSVSAYRRSVYNDPTSGKLVSVYIGSENMIILETPHATAATPYDYQTYFFDTVTGENAFRSTSKQYHWTSMACWPLCMPYTYPAGQITHQGVTFLDGIDRRILEVDMVMSTTPISDLNTVPELNAFAFDPVGYKSMESIKPTCFLSSIATSDRPEPFPGFNVGGITLPSSQQCNFQADKPFSPAGIIYELDFVSSCPYVEYSKGLYA